MHRFTGLTQNLHSFFRGKQPSLVSLRCLKIIGLVMFPQEGQRGRMKELISQEARRRINELTSQEAQQITK